MPDGGTALTRCESARSASGARAGKASFVMAEAYVTAAPHGQRRAARGCGAGAGRSPATTMPAATASPPARRWRWAGATVASPPHRQLDCDGQHQAPCRSWRTVAISDRSNLAATGPITAGRAQAGRECVRWARSNFLADLSRATGCWTAEVTGERSRGGGTIVLWPDGSLEPFW